MASRRKRKKNYKIDATELHPKQAQALRQGDENDPLRVYDVDRDTGQKSFILPGERGAHMPSGLEVAQRVVTEKQSGTARVPLPRFIAETTSTGFVRQALDGRKFADATLSFPPDVVRAIQAGMICLRCLEPQPFSFADKHVPGCEGVGAFGPTYMKDRQIVDFALEFEGEKHVGPSKPMSEYDAEIEERREKRKFEQKIVEGKSRGH